MLSGLGGVSAQKGKNSDLTYFKRGCVITLLRGRQGGRGKIDMMKVSKDNQHPSRNFELNPALKGSGVIGIPRKFS